MNSVKCPRCNLTNWATAPTCKRCGDPISAGGEAYSTTFESAHNYSNSIVHDPSIANPKNGMAIASMVLGIVSLVLGCLGGFLLAPVGFILGIVALVRSNRRPFEYGGRGIAVAGTILSGIGMLSIPIVLAIAIPNLLAARRAAYEAGAVSSIRTIASAEQTFAGTARSGSCADLNSLGAARLIDPVLATGEKSGYRFTIKGSSSSSSVCEIYATPVNAKSITATGTRSFFISTEDYVVRAAQRGGQAANQNDPPFETNYSRDRR